MDSTMKLYFFLIIISQTFLLLSQISKASSSSDYYTSFIYKNCSSQTLIDSTESLPKSLHSLFQQLVPQSSKSKFFKATSSAADSSAAAVSGSFQCRGDLSNQDCYDCVNTLPAELSNSSFCNKAVAGRIQLRGCYFHYQTDEFVSVDDDTLNKYVLINKVCGQTAGEGSGGFEEEQRDKAFAAMESGVIEGNNNNNGFHSGEYESVHAMAQCEGDMDGCECGECVSNAVQIAQEDCIGSISGQIYLDRCFISYGNSEIKDQRIGNSTGKAVAIVLGVAAAMGFGFIFYLFIKSCGKKDDIW